MSKKPKPVLGKFGRLIGRVVLRYYEHDVARDSAALTYYLLFAIFPLLIFISVLLGALALNVERITEFLSNVAPPAVAGIVENYLNYVSENTSSKLMWFSLVFSIWFPMRATSCLMHSLRKALGYGPPKSIWLSTLRTLVFAVLLIGTIVVTTLLSMVGGRALHFVSERVEIPEGFITAWGYLRFVLMALVMATMLSALYMLAAGERLPLRRVLPGVISSLVAWLLVSMAFSYYVEHFAHYAEFYGSIATIVVVLLWLYWSGSVLIMGAELNGALIEVWGSQNVPAEAGEEEGS
ncbi:MAG: YihY/virulence factor BrkB family protein [Oscillospiraceae bacterium]|nr:YihY/virulence factor BrkB family protein [Oscillospiraceae bacterium]